LWPEEYVARLIKLHKEFKKAWTNSERPDTTNDYKRAAANKAAKLRKKNQDFKSYMNLNLTPERNRVDGRRLDPDAGIRRPQFSRPHTSYELLMRNLTRAKIYSQKIIHGGEIESWDENTRLSVRSELCWLNDFLKMLRKGPCR
jgi:hypothetical protein